MAWFIIAKARQRTDSGISTGTVYTKLVVTLFRNTHDHVVYVLERAGGAISFRRERIHADVDTGPPGDRGPTFLHTRKNVSRVATARHGFGVIVSTDII